MTTKLALKQEKLPFQFAEFEKEDHHSLLGVEGRLLRIRSNLGNSKSISDDLIFDFKNEAV